MEISLRFDENPPKCTGRIILVLFEIAFKIFLENKMPFDKECSYHFYWIRVKKRAKFRKILSEKGIETGIHYKPIHTFSFYKSKIKLPITEKVGSEIVTLPTHPNLTQNDVEKIIKVVNKLL